MKTPIAHTAVSWLQQTECNLEALHTGQGAIRQCIVPDPNGELYKMHGISEANEQCTLRPSLWINNLD